MKIKLLLVEDEYGLLKTLQRFFRHERFRVFTANDGREALSVLRKNSVDIIISDYEMPHVNGIELLKKVREEYPNIDFVLTSGSIDIDFSNDFIRRNTYRCFTKPYDLSDIHDTVIEISEKNFRTKVPTREKHD